MINPHWIAACVPLIATVVHASDNAPETTISNGLLRARVYLPDASKGFYRGTRFDWSGVIADLEHAGHNFYPQWFARMDPNVVDFTYAGEHILAGPCTAITGPCEEFNTDGKGLGYDEAKAGGVFIKIGVGVLRKPDSSKYSPFRLYELVDGGEWSVQPRANAVAFEQVLSDATTGYGYNYRKTVLLSEGKAQMVLEHSLRNTGQRQIHSSVYNHNFLFLDRQAPGPDLTIRFPFSAEASATLDSRLAEIQGRQLLFKKTLSGEDRVYTELLGYGTSPRDYDFQIQNRSSGAGVRMTSDRPISKLALWSIRAPMCLEPFIDFTIEPGAEFTWRIVYDYLK